MIYKTVRKGGRVRRFVHSGIVTVMDRMRTLGLEEDVRFCTAERKVYREWLSTGGMPDREVSTNGRIYPYRFGPVIDKILLEMAGGVDL